MYAINLIKGKITMFRDVWHKRRSWQILMSGIKLTTKKIMILLGIYLRSGEIVTLGVVWHKVYKGTNSAIREE